MHKSSMVKKDLVAASSTPLILLILQGGESYGYEIIQRVRELSDDELQWTDGMLYPVLHRLEKEGKIKSTWRVSETGRKRKYYSLKGAGVKALKEERRQWDAVNSTLGKLWGESYV
ncbi:helix-turn-helix transcriptional regulator [Puniceicoccaceae bacterium K14]|nr:helix-turn-helix transcriptional regulator [Puniceicoccaceae bacterium K14]